ncbi:MAG: L-2-hydroxyglutarate oxidase [Cellvibrionaceae bacterium]
MFDYIILGAGIVGLSTAMQIKKKFPLRKVLVIEKEKNIALHQTGHNSGVIHSGIYYKPGSYKANFCRQGAQDLQKYCLENDVPFKITGKLIVATHQKELQALNDLFELSQANGVPVEFLSKGELREKESNVGGKAAIFVRNTGIVNYADVTESYANNFKKIGGEIVFSTKIIKIIEKKESIELVSEKNTYRAKYLIACCGLQADRVAGMMEIKTDFKIIPIRGEYYQVKGDKKHIVDIPIYPVPDPSVPFLGVHITPMMNGDMTVGPNAVVGWNRENYKPSVRINFQDSFDSLAFSGFWKMGWKHKRYAFNEIADSLIKERYVRRVQQYCPSIQSSDLTAYPAGIRAQAVRASGELVSDFLFAETSRSLHVCNAPSPAATSSLSIGQHLCDKIANFSI